jgi:hypothetical protein
MVSTTPRPLSTPGKDPVPIVQEARWAPGSVWTCVKNLAPTGIRPPDRPARLSYPAHSACKGQLYLFYVYRVYNIKLPLQLFKCFV